MSYPDTEKAVGSLQEAEKLLAQVLDRNLGRLDQARSLFEDDERDLRYAIQWIKAAKAKL